jgi:alpha-D-xyloside xylohydrolase
MAQINGWYIKNPPWKQVERAANNADKLAPNWEEMEAQCRRVMELRMRLIPYLHAAFVRYQRQGLPPFRALVMDYPGDAGTWTVDNQFLAGDALMVAPAFAGEESRSVYLPAGDWFDFWSGKKYAGKQKITVSPAIEEIPIFVKGGTVLPLAEPTLETGNPDSWRLRAQVYGEGAAQATLFEDDGSWAPALREVNLAWDGARGQANGSRYQVIEWRKVSAAV